MAVDERQLIQEAVEELQKMTGVAVRVDVVPPTVENDEVIRIEKGGKQWRLQAEAKLHLTRERLALWAAQRPRQKGEKILVTDFVPPALADQMKQMDTAFMDTAGNAYINLPGLYIFVKGNKRPDLEGPQQRPRAFKPTGLRVIYALLCNPGLENRTYREIATAAAVALGTVNWVMRDLKAQGHLMEMGNQNRRLRNKRDLFNIWVTTYPRDLKPKVLIGRYATKDYEWWNHATPGVEGALWGGEVAAALLTRYLTPATATIYLQEQLNELIVKHGLRKDPQGKVEILNAFWNFDHTDQGLHTVHPLLVYADLVATGDPRNIETARMIDDNELARYLRED